MSFQLNKFDFYKPVQSTDIVKVSKPIANIQDPTNPIKPKFKKNKTRNMNNMVKSNYEKQQETQEDIEAWKEARRKNYPTSMKIEEKEKHKKDLEERGALNLEPSKPGKKKKNDKPIQMSSKHPIKIPSYLDKLTEDEDRRDRSKILQCFRYFNTHNFLQDN